ncbi:MAG TPA: beta-galactosidase [Tepidisphaeraceae bacterium]|nr:beta-galactosidase [Tepidisphaeraceae bacterium]
MCLPSAATGAPAAPMGAATDVAVLVDANTIDVRDAATNQRRYRVKLEGPAAPRVRLLVADAAASTPGPELLTVREDGYVDVFPLPDGPAQPLKRLGVIALQRASGDLRVVGAAMPSAPATVALIALRDDAGQIRVTSFDIVPDAQAWRGRSSKSVTLKGAGRASINIDGRSMELTPAAVGVRVTGEGIADAILRDDLPATALPPIAQPASVTRTATWQASYGDDDRLVDLRPLLQQFEARDGTATDPEGSAAGFVLAKDEPRLVLPLNVALSPGTTGLGLWMTERRDNGVRFMLRQGGVRRYVESGYTEGTVSGPNQFFWVSHQAGVLAWHLRRGHLAMPVPASGAEVVLESIEIVRRKPETTISIGPLIVTTTAAPEHATRVWKLKNHNSPKTDSTFWTSDRFYDYGFEAEARLRPSAWRLALGNDPAKPVSRLRAVLRTTTGEPIWSTSLAQVEELDRPIDLPRLPVGCYTLELTAFNTAEAVVGNTDFNYQVLRDDGAPATLPRDGAAAYPWKLSGLKLGGPAASVGQPLRSTVDAATLLTGRSGPVTLTWSVKDVEGREQAAGSAALTAAAPSATLDLPTARGGGFTLTIRFTATDGAHLDGTDYVYGVDAPLAPSMPATSVLPKPTTRPLVLSQTKVTEDPEHTQRLPQSTLPNLVEWAYAHETVPSFLIFWRELEPVEGCYNWDAIDRYLAFATDGRQAAIGVNFSGDNLPEWLWFEELLSQNQQTIHHDYHYASPLGPRVRAAQERLWRAVVTRYQRDPRVVSYALQAGPSEGFITDTPPKIADYSEHAVKAFRAYLRTRYESIGKLNAAWSATFASFDVVRPPIPDFSLAWETSVAWYDFHNFKLGFVPDYLDALQRLTRAIDPDRPVYMYAKEGFGPPGLLGPVFKRNRYIYSNGGGENRSSFVQASIMRGHGVNVMVEPGQVQANVGTIARLSFYSLLAGGYGGHNLQWGLVWAKKPHIGMPEYNAVGALCKAMSQHAGTLATLRPAVTWAGYYSSTTELLQSRSMRCLLYDGVRDLNDASQTVLATPCAWVDDVSPLEVLSKYPLIVDGGSRVLTPASADTIEAYVRGGGVFVCDVTAGMHQPTTAKRTDHLLARFGFEVDPAIDARAATIDVGGGVSLKLESVSTLRPLPSDAKVIIRNASGDPVVVERPLGRGRVIVVAGQLDRRASAAWIGGLVAQHAGIAPYKVAGDRVLSGMMRGDDGATFVVLHPMAYVDGREVAQASLDDISRAGDATVTIGGLPANAKCVDLISGRALDVRDGVADITLPRGLLAVVRISEK